jgi:hypothetical protein
MSVGDCTASKPVSADLVTASAIAVSGTVQLPGGADGGGVPVPNATVYLTPSLSSITIPPPAVPASPIDFPRSFEVTTDANGHFVFSPVDQAYVGEGLYDITVRPPDGTSLPWVVSPNHLISSQADAVTTFPLTVPAPAPLTLTLHDPDDNAVIGALVRAYAFPTCSALPCSGAIQIGEALTDSTGSFQMFLAPSPFTAGAP